MITHQFRDNGVFPIITNADSDIVNTRMQGEVRTGVFHVQNDNTTAVTVSLYGSMDNYNANSYTLIHTTASLASNGTKTESTVVTLFPFMYAKASADNASIRAYIGE